MESSYDVNWSGASGNVCCAKNKKEIDRDPKGCTSYLGAV
jgi:hypothetical protein